MDGWRALLSDIGLAMRRLAAAPGLTVVCILTLAIGIGGNTSVFTLIDRVMLKPLPVQRPSELYRLGNTDDCCVNSGLFGSFAIFSYDLYAHLRDSAPQFTTLAAFQANTRAITIGRTDTDVPPETLNGSFVSGNYFHLFELVPAAGRLIQDSDDRAGAPPVAVISYRAWRDRFGQRGDIGGVAVMLNGVHATIAGVAPEGFYGAMLRPDPPDIWIPLANEPLLQPAARLLEAKGSHWLYVMGRLRPATPIAPIQAKLTAELRHWLLSTLDLSREDRKQVPQQHINIVSAAAGVSNLRDEVSPALKLLQALAVAVLLIACANLANILLASGMARRTETAVRVALGASRRRLVGQFLVESVLLALAGGALGLIVAIAGARAIVGLAFRGATHIPVDPWPSPIVVGFAFGVALLTGALFGVAPAVVGSRSDPIEAMRGAGRTTSERGARLRRSLIALQVAMSFVIVSSAGLLGRSLHNLEAQDFGFRPESRYVVTLAPSLSTVPAAQLSTLYARMQEALLRIPGVVNAAFSLYGPMSGDNWASLITVEGHAASERLVASWNRVSPGYFDTIGTPILRGRAFDERDRPDSPLVAVVTQAFAKRFFGDADPIGRRIGFSDQRGEGPREFEVVGLVGDAKYQDGRRPPFVTFFLPFLQQTAASRARAAKGGVEIDRSHYPGAVEIHATGAVHNLEAEVRRALATVDRRITVRAVVPMPEQIARAFNLERLIARLAIAFGAAALLLACLGLYGVTAYSVTRRTREIGIRMAVGASRARVLRTILRGALIQFVVGIAIGLPAALAAGRFLQSHLYGVTAQDPPVIAGALAVLALSAALAALLPARRAAAMDPVSALRVE